MRTIVSFETRVAWVLAGLVLLAGCSGEATTPIDLGSSTTVTGVPATADHGQVAPDEDLNAESRQMAIDFAEQQCFDDPEAEQGVIRIVEPETEQVVGEVVVDCEEVRSSAVED